MSILNVPADENSQAPGDAAMDASRGQYLRVGVLLDSWTERAWIARIIEDIQQSDVARVVAVAVNRTERPSRWRRFFKLLPYVFYLVYYRVDRWIMRRLTRARSDAFDQVDLRPSLSEAKSLDVRPICGRFSDRFDSASLDWIRAQQLDVILRFGFRILRGPILESARYGVWSFHHGDNREYRGVPAMFWEMYEGNPVTGVTLQVLTEQLDGGKVIFRCDEKTNFMSLYLNHHRLCWKGTVGIMLRLKQLAEGGWPAVSQLDTYREQSTYTKPIYRLPGNFVMFKFFATTAARVARRLLTDLVTEEEWFVAWRRRPSPTTVPPSPSGEPFRRLSPPRTYSFADPFPILHQGRHYILFEDFDASMHGVISCVELDEAGNASQPRVVLSTDCHLSYPYLFEHDRTVYMIPETRQHRRIELWRAESFPDHWVFDRVLIDDIAAVDATWLGYQGRYWLFAAVAVDGSMGSDHLHLYSSDAPLGPWRPHRANPIVTTIRGSRPAGHLFVHNGQLIRPGQDSAKVYGHQVYFHRVDQLDDACYRETRIGALPPDWTPGNVGTHTYNCAGQYEVIDGRVRAMRRPWRRKPVRGVK
jgi:hypothetical protein